MFSGILYFIFAHLLILVVFTPFINKSFSPLSCYSRLAIAHRIFSLRIKFFSFLNPYIMKIDSDSKALEELISLYYPILSLNDNLTSNDINTFRYHSKRLLTGLYPMRSSTCTIEYHMFQYNVDRIDVYAIKNNINTNWKYSNEPVVLYFHGGGFVLDGIETYSGIECHISEHLNMLILHVNFHHVPECELVNIIDDAINVYEILLDVDPNIHQRLIGMGDSSGGMLWIYLLQEIISMNKPVPKCVVLHSPWPDLEFFNLNYNIMMNSYPSVELLFNLRQLIIGKDKNWFQLSTEEKGKISPSKTAFTSFPPMFITAGTNEIFIDEIRDMVKNMRASKVNVTLVEAEGLMHIYALFHLWSPKAVGVQEKIRQWIDEQLFENTKKKKET